LTIHYVLVIITTIIRKTVKGNDENNTRFLYAQREDGWCKSSWGKLGDHFWAVKL